MLPEKLSTNLTSLNYQADRQAVVIEMTVNDAGDIQSSDIYQAIVRNHAKLAYNGVADWLEGKAAIPLAIDAAIADNLRIQDKVAQGNNAVLWNCRHWKPALFLQVTRLRTYRQTRRTGPSN